MGCDACCLTSWRNAAVFWHELTDLRIKEDQEKIGSCIIEEDEVKIEDKGLFLFACVTLEFSSFPPY